MTPWAALDPGASVNALAVAAVARTPAGVWVPVYLAEESGASGRPLDLRNVLVPHASALRAIGCSAWLSDGWAAHDVIHAGREGGLATLPPTGGELWEQWRHSMALAARGAWSFAPHRRLAREQWPLLDVLTEQLATVLESLRAGRRTVLVPEVGASHGDLAVAFNRALLHARAADVQDDDHGPRERAAPDPYADETDALVETDF